MSAVGGSPARVAFADPSGVQSGLLPGVWAFVGETTSIYAAQRAGRVAVIGMHSQRPEPDSVRKALVELASELDGWIVAWRRTETTPAVLGL